MENKLDVLTQKLYDEGVDKAKQKAEEIIKKAEQDADGLIADAEAKAKSILEAAGTEVGNQKKKAESEMELSARQAVAALKQSITGLIAGKVAGEMAKAGFEDKAFVQELLMTVVKKWEIASGNLDLEILLSPDEKDKFEAYVASKYKDLLDKGLEIKAGGQQEAFVLRPKNGGYQIAFSEALFEAFFNQYMRSFTKTLLYKQS